jgi:hypothetical protein
MIKKLPALAAAIPLAVGQVFGPHDLHLEPSVKTPTSALVGVPTSANHTATSHIIWSLDPYINFR